MKEEDKELIRDNDDVVEVCERFLHSLLPHFSEELLKSDIKDRDEIYARRLKYAGAAEIADLFVRKIKEIKRAKRS